ncbi:sucrose-specific PTS transporter subunit IIBC [Clostridium perfringens]|uniref:sucrose-specific PTS transporter subunit IIBC n=1 Tax=Clostridium perfringens TaxID=1502 RepID=UPI00066869E7|nr:sucrose-specific PTS transporter subunit IIBC [Clostridium perfringens]EJT6167205.1 PTS transporter subunit EIIC [Clostridium perfringens]EJT6620269.1 PTS transporter subunit EIIC [Clostridium perfringens]MBX9099781.1 PTS transporter subunit EIIC [Clostridium perfringens]MDB2040868.1 sucrose-specific PTS transporter subunit IIBC [Clostridium perfringens]MDB2049266.1 sucrose-specific PTS transporter subunit IIBC [Clostridium perfringens]
MSKEQIVAQEILKNIGGKENIKSMEHCATRLRLIVKDKSLINEKAIENIDGVRGQFFAAAQYQIILGTGFVNKVFAAMNGEGVETGNVKEDAYSDMSLPQKISRTLGDIFVPIIPVLVATGLFMGLRGLLTNLGVEFSPTFNTLSEVLTDTAFIFLPALVAWSTMKKFGGTPVVGIVLGLMLVAPQLPNAWQVAGGANPIHISLLGISIPIVGYQGSVLPALVLGIIAAKLEKFIRKFMPDVLDLIFTPFLTLLVSMILGLLVVGPIMHTSEVYILDLFKMFLSLPFGIGGAIIGGVHQVIVVTGVHHIFNALEVELISSTGLNPFNAVITGAIVAQGAAALAVGFKTKDKKKRSLYISSAIPAFLGITEAAIFGVNLRFIKPFIFACIGGAASGMFASIMKLAGTGMGITAIPGTLLYINTGLIQYFITIAIGFAISFALTYIFFKPQE